MPVDYYIDHAHRLVVAHYKGIFSTSDVTRYQLEVRSQPEVAGFDELVDLTGVEEIAVHIPVGPDFEELASLAAVHDPPGSMAKLAIVAPTALAFGLASAYKTFRELDPHNRKQVGVFRTMDEALSFLGIKALKEPESR
jgi:hypothetical protein